ncbi:MAG TPA: hypothetical protein VF534_01740 [Paraburkholderia sp.]
MKNAAELLHIITLLCEENGEPCDGYRFRELILESRALLAAAPLPTVPLVEPVDSLKAIRAGRRAEVWLNGGKGPEAMVAIVNVGLTGWHLDEPGANAYADGFNRGADLVRAAYSQQIESRGTGNFYVAANDNNPGFLVYGTGINDGKPEFCPSLRHAAPFATYADADAAANRAGLVCYTIVQPALGATE